MIFVQRNGVTIRDCTFLCRGLEFGVIACQSADSFDNFTMQGCYVEFDANNTAGGAGIQADIENPVFQGNVWKSFSSGTHSILEFRNGSSGRDIGRAAVMGDVFIKAGIGNCTGIVFDGQAGGQIVASNVDGCYFDGLDTDVQFTGTTAQIVGTHRVTNNNSNVGAVTISGSPTGGTADFRNNST